MVLNQNDPLLQLLSSLSGKRVHYFPNPGNAGDGFIAYATYILFEKYNISVVTCRYSDVLAGETILIGGGGNLIEGRYDHVATVIRNNCKSNQIYLLPHTVVGYSELLQETWNNLTVLCRDPVSQRLAVLNGSNPERTQLTHDLTFFLDDDHFADSKRSGEGQITVLRVDGESARIMPVPSENIDISLSWNGDIWQSRELAIYATKSLTAYLAPYESVVTDRLHIAILSAFLGKRVTMLPNDYFKNRVIFEHSIAPRFKNVEFLDAKPAYDSTEGTAYRALRQQLEEEAGRRLDLQTELAGLQSVLVSVEARIPDLERTIQEREHEIRSLTEVHAESERRWVETAADLAARERASAEAASQARDQANTISSHYKDQLEKAQRLIDGYETEFRRMSEIIAHLSSSAAEMEARASGLAEAINRIAGSTTWKAMEPFRRFGRKMPEPARLLARRSAQVAWWALSFQLIARWKRRQEALEPLPLPAPVISDIEIELATEPPAAAHQHIEEPPSFETSVVPHLKSHFLAGFSDASLISAYSRLQHFPVFSRDDYLSMNPDLGRTSTDAVAHAMSYGVFEGRQLFRRDRVARSLVSSTVTEGVDRIMREPLPTVEEQRATIAALKRELGDIGVYVSSLGNTFMSEIAGDLVATLAKAGVHAELRDENSDIDDRLKTNVFVAPHEFFILGRGPEWIREDVICDSFTFGTEQIQTPWFAKALPWTLMARGAFEISAQTAALLNASGVPTMHLEPAPDLRQRWLKPKDRLHSLYRVLPSGAQKDPDPHSSWSDRPIDISFFGGESERRQDFFSRNAGFLADYETYIYYRQNAGPIAHRSNEEILTRLAGHVSGHSKISLNVHRDELNYFEWHRMVRIGMSAGAVVVSDPCLAHPHVRPGIHYFEEEPRHIPNLIEWLIRAEDGQRRAAEVRANATNLFSGGLAAQATTYKVLNFVSRHMRTA